MVGEARGMIGQRRGGGGGKGRKGYERIGYERVREWSGWVRN